MSFWITDQPMNPKIEHVKLQICQLQHLNTNNIGNIQNCTLIAARELPQTANPSAVTLISFPAKLNYIRNNNNARKRTHRHADDLRLRSAAHLVPVVSVAGGSGDEYRPPRPDAVLLLLGALIAARRGGLLLPRHPDHGVPLPLRSVGPRRRTQQQEQREAPPRRHPSAQVRSQ